MNIGEKVIKIVQENSEKKLKLNLDDSIKGAGIDSLGMLMIVDALEDEFGIEIDRDEVLEIDSVRDIVDCIEKRVK